MNPTIGLREGRESALAVSRGRYVLLLNSDTLVKDQRHDYGRIPDDHPDVGAVLQAMDEMDT